MVFPAATRAAFPYDGHYYVDYQEVENENKEYDDFVVVVKN